MAASSRVRSPFHPPLLYSLRFCSLAVQLKPLCPIDPHLRQRLYLISNFVFSESDGQSRLMWPRWPHSLQIALAIPPTADGVGFSPRPLAPPPQRQPRRRTRGASRPATYWCCLYALHPAVPASVRSPAESAPAPLQLFGERLEENQAGLAYKVCEL